MLRHHHHHAQHAPNSLICKLCTWPKAVESRCPHPICCCLFSCQLPSYSSPSAAQPISLTASDFFPHLLMEGPSPGTIKQALAPMHGLAASLVDSAQLEAGVEAMTAAQHLLQLALAGGVEGKTPMQLLQRAEQLLTGTCALLPVSALEQQHHDRVAAEHDSAAAAAAAGAAAADVSASGFETFKAAANKYKDQQHAIQKLLAKLLWQQLQLQPAIAAASLRLAERYMKAAAEAGKAASMKQDFSEFAATSASVHDEAVPQLAADAGELLEDAAGWAAVLQGSLAAQNPQQWAAWTARLKQAIAKLTRSWQQLTEHTCAAACCGPEKLAVFKKSTSPYVRQATAAARDRTVVAAADALMQLPADAVERLQQAVQGCKQQLLAFDLVLRRSEPAGGEPTGPAATAAAAAAAAAAGVVAPNSSAASRCWQRKRCCQSPKQQKRELKKLGGRLDMDACRTSSTYLRLYQAREAAEAQVCVCVCDVDVFPCHYTLCTGDPSLQQQLGWAAPEGSCSTPGS
jgi:hypothetical protein